MACKYTTSLSGTLFPAFRRDTIKGLTVSQKYPASFGKSPCGFDSKHFFNFSSLGECDLTKWRDAEDSVIQWEKGHGWKGHWITERISHAAIGKGAKPTRALQRGHQPHKEHWRTSKNHWRQMTHPRCFRRQPFLVLWICHWRCWSSASPLRMLAECQFRSCWPSCRLLCSSSRCSSRTWPRWQGVASAEWSCAYPRLKWFWSASVRWIGISSIKISKISSSRFLSRCCLLRSVDL